MSVIFGTDLDDSLTGTDSNDRIYGKAGKDTVSGGSGDDLLCGGDGDDTVYGDTLYGSESGNDRIYGDAGNDLLFGGYGTDEIYGGSGNDSLNGYYGNDRLYGDSGDDWLTGSWGNDVVNGGSGNDYIDGAGGRRPNDMYSSASRGNREIDILTGGRGADTFNFKSSGAGRDGIGVSYWFASNADYALITDFNKNEDVIRLAKTESGPGVYPDITIEYSLGAAPEGLPQGTGIYVNNLPGAKPDLIAILQGVSPNSLSLSGSYFQIS